MTDGLTSELVQRYEATLRQVEAELERVTRERDAYKRVVDAVRWSFTPDSAEAWYRRWAAETLDTQPLWRKYFSRIADALGKLRKREDGSDLDEPFTQKDLDAIAEWSNRLRNIGEDQCSQPGT